MARTKIARLLNSNSNVILSPRGIDQFAFYFEFITLRPNREQMSDYTRLLVADKYVYMYRRDPDKSRTVWRRLAAKSEPQAAHEYAVNIFNMNPRNVLMGSPILAQMEPSDLSQMASGGIPGVRYRAHGYFKSIYGESDVNFEERSINIPMSTIGVEHALNELTASKTPKTPIVSVSPVTPPAVSISGGPTGTTPVGTATDLTANIAASLGKADDAVTRMLDEQRRRREEEPIGCGTPDLPEPEYGDEPY